MASQLGALQQELLESFFELQDGFFLSGGAALVGYHLAHRTTEDLDLFTTQDRLEEGERSLRAAAERIGASLEGLQRSTDFRRWLARRGDEGVVVDLIRERVPQGTEEKPRFGSVAVDPPEEILANKLGTLLARAEIRDLVDVMFLEKAGYAIEAALPLAIRKDGGLTPGQLAWVLSQFQISGDAMLPGGVAPAELCAYLDQLRDRLIRLAHPGG